MKSLISTFIILLTSIATSASVDPLVYWKILSTDHFDVIFDERQETLAREYAMQAERAHSIMIEIFKEAPPKTTLWIFDQTDMANGSATPFPRPLVIAFPVLPTVIDSIGHYDNWSQGLITHEYAHILNMEPANGFPGLLSNIFGTIVRPNALLPRWYLEGLAVEMESRFGKTGRLKSVFYESLIRAMVQDETWTRDSIAHINEGTIPSWPLGMRPYFGGALLLHDLTERKGVEVFGDLNDRYSRRIPFLLNGPPEDIFGLDYEHLFEAMRLKYKSLAEKQLQAIQTAGITKSKNISNLRTSSHSATFSKDGEILLFITQNLDGESEILISEKGGPQKSLLSGKRIHRASWMPTSKQFIF